MTTGDPIRENPIRVIIADDHALFRQGLRSLLELEDSVQVVAEVERAAALAPTLAANPCDIVLLDLQMDRWSMDDIAALARETAVIVLTASENVENGMNALRNGARGVVHKRFAIESLLSAIGTVAQGMVWMPPSLQTALAQQEREPSTKLTAREAEVVRCVAMGLRNAQIAERLELSESTVKTHLSSIFQKLGIRSRLGLLHHAVKIGLVPGGDS
jgi:two-component system NarL family response regulator